MTKKPLKQFPPVPAWRPSIMMPFDRIVERMKYYTSGRSDFAVFQYGTCVLLENDLSDERAEQSAKEVLNRIFYQHPDMLPLEMDDGNVLVSYNHPAVNVVLRDIVKENWSEIDRRHEDAFAGSEVLVADSGLNQVNELVKMALFGRCFMFMDAQNPRVVRVERQ